MIIALYCVAAAMILGGVYSAITGWEIVILERGWTQVLSGVIVATGGVMLAGIAFLAAHLRQLNETLRSGGAQGAATRSVAPDGIASPNLDTDSASKAAAPASGALAGAAAVALSGLDKTRNAFGAKSAPDISTPPAEPEATATPDPAPRLSDEFLARATQLEDRESREGEVEGEGKGKREVKPDHAAGLDPVVPAEAPAAPPPLPDQDPAPGPDDAMPAGDDARIEDESRNMFADALFADDVASRISADEPRTEEPGSRKPSLLDSIAQELESDGASVDETVPDERPAPVDIDERGPDIKQESAGPDGVPAEEPALTPTSDSTSAVTSEQERFAALLADQTRVDEEQHEAPQDAESDTVAQEDEALRDEPAQSSEPLPAFLPEPEEATEPELDIAPEIAPAPEQDPIAEHPPVQETAPEPLQPEPVSEPEPGEEPAREAVEEPVEERSIIGTYESGGNTYTMYADGSIDARTPEGDYHFASLDELKTFIAEGGENQGS